MTARSCTSRPWMLWQMDPPPAKAGSSLKGGLGESTYCRSSESSLHGGCRASDRWVYRIATERNNCVSAHLLIELTIFVLAVFVGFEVISKVPAMLHTPLMSATNAIHGIVLVGALLVAGIAAPKLGAVLAVVVVVLATVN